MDESVARLSTTEEDSTLSSSPYLYSEETRLLDNRPLTPISQASLVSSPQLKNKGTENDDTKNPTVIKSTKQDKGQQPPSSDINTSTSYEVPSGGQISPVYVEDPGESSMDHKFTFSAE